MQIKRFQAASMADALELVKRDLGSEAVILSACSRKNTKGLLSSFKKAGVEVTAAGNGPLPPVHPHQTIAESETVAFDRGAVPALGQRRRTRPRLTERISYSTPNKPVRSPVQRSKPRRMAVGQEPQESGAIMDHGLYQRLIDHGVEEEYVREIIAVASPADDIVEPQSVDSSARVMDGLEKMGLTTRGPAAGEGHPRYLAVVGASGVGKTTAIAKLAAAYTLDDNLRVALISLDNIRVAASDQLQVFADIIGIPQLTVADNSGLESALEKFRQHDLVLIDTPGLCFRSTDRVLALAELFETMGELEIHLLYSATSRLRDNLQLFESLAGIRVDRLMFSKIDETSCYGDILNLLLKLQLPLSFFFDDVAGPDGVSKAGFKALADLLSKDVHVTCSSYALGAGKNGDRSVRPVPMRWMPLPDDDDASSETEDAPVGQQTKTEITRNSSGFFRFNGKTKRCTTA